MSEVSRYTSAIPPLHTVKDPDVRRVLEALVNGWRTRNGDAKPDSEQRFITKGELQTLVQDINNGYFTNGSGAKLLERALSDVPTSVQTYVAGLVDAMQREVLNSPLWAELGAQIQRIDTAVVAEQLARIGAVQQVANDLAAEAEARLGFESVTGSAIARLEESDATQATIISGLTTRVSGAESTVVTLQQTTTTTATNLTQLTTRVSTAENTITDLETTSATQAQTLSSLSTRVVGAESSISTLNTTTANQATRLNAVEASTAATQAAITNEATTRANADNAITSNVNTQLSTVNQNVAAIQTQTTTLSNTVGSFSNSITTLQSSVGQLSTALSTEATTRASADGTINSKYTVKVDNNGYVSGFGLISTANNDTSFSEFIVRSDRFAVGSPGTPDRVPFIVQSGVTYIDTALIKDASIGSAKIGVAAVDTLRIAGEAVFVARWANGNVPATFGQVPGVIAILYLPISGLPDGAVASVIVNGVANYSPIDASGASIYTNITVNGSRVTASFGVTVNSASVFHGNSAVVELGNGVHTIALTTEVGPPGVSSKFLAAWGVLTASAGKR